MTDRLVERVREATGAIVLVGVALIQSPGQVVADTKLDLVLAPGGFLGRALQAWDPQAAFGQLQNQAYGYLFPMGPFFWAGHTLGVPAWVVQRLWWVLVLLVAYTGFVRLARVLGVGTPTTQVVGGVAYALAPRVVTVLGAISAEAVPMAVLPWVLLPLVHGARGGSPRRAAAASALAVACIGGVNAAATLAVLVVPLMFLLTRGRGPRARRLLGWWLGCTALAVSWWMLPLLVLGRYSYPFLDYIETSAVTTSVTSVSNVLRGADHWLGYLVTGDGATWPAGYELATRPLLVVATVLVAALGLSGIAARATPERRFLAWSLLVGLLLVGLGYAGAAGSPVSGPVQSLLDGPLAPFRNVHKFDPVLRLPIVLGLAAALARVPEAARRIVARVPGEEGVWLRARPVLVTGAATTSAVALVALAALPALGGRLSPPGAFDEVPASWSAAADWLADHSSAGAGRTLLVPASQFGDYTWGRPADEPLQALARSPWAVRNAVPLGAPGATRLLDAVESELALGRGSAVLAPALRRAGVQYLVLRNDLDAFTAGTPPIVARATLLASPGLAKVAGFGGTPDPFQWSLFSAGRSQPDDLQALEVFQVSGAASGVSLLDDDPVRLSGGPEATLGAAAALDGVALVAAADGGPAGPSLVTDTLRRRSKAFGSPTPRDYTPTLQAGEDVARGRPAGDVLPYEGPVHETVALLDGVRGVAASSSAAEPTAARALGPAYRPAAAVDGDPATAWVSDLGDRRPVLRLDLERPTRLSAVTVSARGLPPTVPPPRGVSVTTDVGTGSARVVDGQARVALPAGTTTTLRIVLEPGGDGSAGTGVSEVTAVGLPQVAEPLAVPGDSVGGPTTRWVLAREPGARRACILPGPEWVCDETLSRAGEERLLDRVLDVGSATAVTMAVDVAPRQGAALDALADSALGVEVRASSRLVEDAAARPGAALDGDPATAWLAAPSDATPTLTVRYREPAVVSGVRLDLPEATADRLAEVVVRSQAGSRRVVPGPDGRAAFAPLAGEQFSVALALVPAEGDAAGAPVAVAELGLDGAPAATRGQVDLACGSGPVVRVDGRSVRTAVRAAAADLVAGVPLPVEVCGTAPPVVLAEGTHRVTAEPTAAFDVERVELTGAGAAATPAVTGPVTVTGWAPERRTVRLDGRAGILALAEGYNAGWRATADGRTLQPVRVDGWRQAWRVPAGTVGEAVLEYAPGRWHRAGLLLGLFAAGAVAVLALAPSRRGRMELPAAVAGAPRRFVAGGATLTGAVLLAGGAGLVGWALARTLGARRPVHAVAVAGLFLAGLSGALVAAGARPHWAAILEQVLAVAVVVMAVRPALAGAPRPNAPGRGAPSAAPEPRAGATTAPLPSPSLRP